MSDGLPICSAVQKTPAGGRVAAPPAWRAVWSPRRRHRRVLTDPRRPDISAPGTTGWGGQVRYPVRRDLDGPVFAPPPSAMDSSPLPLADLPAAFRQRAEAVARFAPGVAEAFAFCAEQVEASLAEHGQEVLTVRQACTAFGWSYDGLRRKLIDDPTLNAGTEGAPLIRRADLPRLGAPRGPRGPYKPRRAKADGCVGDDTKTAAVGTNSAEPTPPGTTDAQPVETPANPDAAGPEEEVAPTTADHTADEEARSLPNATATQPKTAEARARASRKRGRHASQKERFDQLLALAHQG